MPATLRHHAMGLQQADAVAARIGREVRDLRLAAGVSQEQLGRAVGRSRQWIARLELARLAAVDIRIVTLVFAHLGQKLVVNAYPIGEPLRDAGQGRLLRRFNARLSPVWKRFSEAVMPIPGDLRAWDELLRGPVIVGVEAETRPSDLQRTERAIALKARDSGVDRVVLLLADTSRNRRIVRENIGMLRQSFPLDTRATLTALTAGQDPGANGLVII